jgi:hypothetical protein
MRRLTAIEIPLLLIGIAGLTWSGLNARRASAIDRFEILEQQLVQFRSFEPTESAAELTGRHAASVTACDTRAQRALVLLEIPLADAALRSGLVGDYDRRSAEIRSRAKSTLACSPRDSFAWMILFGSAVQAGKLDPAAFDLLRSSYDASPNEAWISIRRTALAVPVASIAPEPIQKKIVAEWRTLIESGYIEMPAQAYVRSHQSVRDLLDAEIERFDRSTRAQFRVAVHKLQLGAKSR